MVQRALAAAILLLTATALPAQHFLAVGSESRHIARAAWLGLSGEQSVTFEHGQPVWRAGYEALMQGSSTETQLLGKGALTTLRTDVDLAFGAQKLARGRYYVGARRGEQQQWSLALFAADKVDASGRGANFLLGNEPDLRVPARLTKVADSVAVFTATLTESRRTPHNLDLTLAWGPYRLGVEITAAFDTRQPQGAPEFALTPAGKGTKTPSGLILEQLRAGMGAPPGPDDTVSVHYAGWLTDGTLFVSSHARGVPEPWRREWIVKGLAEGLQLMPPGSTFRLTLPPELAYGAQGAGDRVPPNATVVFTVTLLGIEKR